MRMLPRGGLGEAEQQPDERRLAGAVGARKPNADAARDDEIDVLERRAGAERLARPRVDPRGLRVGRVDGEAWSPRSLARTSGTGGNRRVAASG
jgi:hypothetical protein